MKRVVLTAIGGVILCGSSTLAHHGSKWFDKAHQTTISGVITELDWAIPHTYVYVDVTGDYGHVENWVVECNGMYNLTRSGWTRGMLAPGTTVSIIANPPWRSTALADTIRSALAGQRLKSGHYLAAGCTTTGSTQLQLGYGPPCLQDAVEMLRRSWHQVEDLRR
jgi:hypothetical protein